MLSHRPSSTWMGDGGASRLRPGPWRGSLKFLFFLLVFFFLLLEGFLPVEISSNLGAPLLIFGSHHDTT